MVFKGLRLVITPESGQGEEWNRFPELPVTVNEYISGGCAWRMLFHHRFRHVASPTVN
jgi:hypothetical protein